MLAVSTARSMGEENTVSTSGVLKAFLQFGQLGTALVAQRDVGAAADVQALQVAGGHAVTDEMELKGFHAKYLVSFAKIQTPGAGARCTEDQSA